MCSTDAFIAASSIRFFYHRLQGFLVQTQIGDQLAKAAIFIPKSLGFLSLTHIHASILRLPGVDRVRAHPNFAGHILCPATSFQLLDRRDHLRFRVLAPRHLPLLLKHTIS
jgi:hypothetical protein